MNNELFEYKYVESNSMSNMAVITKWFICTGNIEIPQTIGNNTIVLGIAINAFNLTGELLYRLFLTVLSSFCV